MILGFKKEINGKPTAFVIKILAYLGKETLVEYLQENTRKDIDFNDLADDLMNFHKPKKLTIRDDKNRRWKSGIKIHFATGVRTSEYKLFAAGQCKDVKYIIFSKEDDHIKIFVDYKELKADEIYQLAYDDGFENPADFLKYHMGTSTYKLKRIIYF